MNAVVLPTTPDIARLRAKNQLTIPESALAVIGARVGDRFVVTVDDGAIRLQPVLETYAGTLAGVYGTGWADELRRDREAW